MIWQTFSSTLHPREGSSKILEHAKTFSSFSSRNRFMVQSFYAYKLCRLTTTRLYISSFLFINQLTHKKFSWVWVTITLSLIINFSHESNCSMYRHESYVHSNSYCVRHERKFSTYFSTVFVITKEQPCSLNYATPYET